MQDGLAAAAPDLTDDPLIGRTLEGYKFLTLLGRGGFGAVYLALHPRLSGRQVAVKYVQLSDPEEYDEAEHEINILTGLQHQHIVQIYDAFRYNDYQLIMMEFISGGSLSGHVEKLGRLDLPTTLEAMIQVSDALAYVHNKGVLHLDLKPANILLEPQENAPFPRFVLTDFGIARFVQPGKHVSEMAGTPSYMAPEQFGFGDEAPDRRADIYQFGVILYELAVGALPFAGGSLVDCARQHAYEPPPRASDRAPGLPPALDEIILKAMAKAPADRFQSAGEINRALSNLRSSVTGAGEAPRQLLSQVRQQADQMRAASVHYTRAVEQVVRRAQLASKPGFSLLITAPSGAQSSAYFDKTTVIVGRSREADLALDQKTLSRRHVQIELDSAGRLFVTDLDSTHGTFLEKTRLPPNQRTLWPPEQRLIIESFTLAAGSVSLGAASALLTEQVKPLLDQLQGQRKQPRVVMNASPEIVYVEMNKPQTILVRVRPENTPTALYELRALPGPGIDPNWYTISAPKTIEAGETATFEVAIAAPSVEVVGGRKYELAIEVAANDSRVPGVFQVIKVMVVPYMRFNITLEPSEVSHRRRGRARLIITNNGNYTETFFVRAQTPDRLHLQPQTDRVIIAPAAYEAVPLRFRPRRDAFKDDRLLFALFVSTQAGLTERANGSYLLPRRRRIPWWLLLLAALVLAVLINWLVFSLSPEAQLQYLSDQINRVRQTLSDMLAGGGR